MKKRIVRVNLSDLNIREEDVPEDLNSLGGRSFTSSVVTKEVPPGCHPLGFENVLVVAPGLLAGTTLTSSNRLSVGGKSPLTGGIKESNSGGVVGFKMARLGIKALIIEGRVEDERKLLGIRIDREGVRFEDLADLKGVATYEASERLRSAYGQKTGLMIAGPAGEMRLPSACISITDPEGEPCRTAARGGLGAVMGSKRLKAVIFDDRGGESPMLDRDAARAAIKNFTSAIKKNPVTGGLFAKYGTARTLNIVNDLGGLPTRNFSSGSFENADKIGGEALYRTISERGGMADHPCMPGCIIRCSNKYVDTEGGHVVGSLDYETLCLLGSNLGIGDLDQIAALNRLCNEIGIDTIETGGALGVLAEAGIMSFGDFEGARRLLLEVQAGTPMGRILGSGVTACGRAFGIERVPAVKNQGMAAYDPRVIKGNGVTYALSPMGADHTAGNTIIAAVDHTDPKGKVELSRDLQIFTAVMDSLGLCVFTARPVMEDTAVVEEIIEAFTGLKISFQRLKETAMSILLLERDFNRKAGIGSAQDAIPGFMRREALPPKGTVFDIEEKAMAAFFDFSR
ncbi:MAG TPA: aldehyde ferredoxin oxidoreductase C-terminal domain-containing protein [Spirochaetia bacterium]|nr:aldehyde ferredoxin oxidoreductase C-terminal domain-containing protein [Spirochaetia bacterium]